jgi:outer membrane protein TolC
MNRLRTCFRFGLVLLACGSLAVFRAEAQTPAPAGAAFAVPPDPGTGSVLRLTVRDAILHGLAHNRALKVERLAPDIRRTFEQQEQAAFQAAWNVELSGGKVANETVRSGDGTTNVDTRTVSARAAVSKTLTTGTRLSVEAAADRFDSSLYGDPFDTLRLGVAVEQPLLRGAGREANLVSLRQARLDALVSAHEYRGFVESLVAQIESAYWDHVLARRRIAIHDESLALAERELADTRERIALGQKAPVELAAAEAEVASRREGMIVARGGEEKARLRLLSLLGASDPAAWRAGIEHLDQPAPVPSVLGDIEPHVRFAIAMRSDLNQARLNRERGQLEVVRTRNGLLPKLDFFVRLGNTGYAASFGEAARETGRNHYDASAGLRFEYPFGNADADARHERARLGSAQADEAISNAEQLVERDVRTAGVEVEQSRERIAATAATVKARDAAYRAETEKFKVGKSTSFQVAQIERDLLASRIEEVQALVDHLKAWVTFYQLEGALLQRRDVVVPAP